MRQSLNISGTLSTVLQDRRSPRRGVLSLALLAMMLGSSLFAQTPDLITHGFGNVGVAATQSQLLFTQPYCSSDALGTLPVARGVYSVNTTTGAASLYAALPTPLTTVNGLFCAEMYIAMAQTGNPGGFPAGSAYVTQGPAIYVVPPGGGAASPMTITGPGAPLIAPFGHSGIAFDMQGTFGFHLIYTSAFGVWEITSAGVATKLAPGINTVSPVLIESPSVAPSGVLYVTGEDETGTAGTGPQSGLYFLSGGSLLPIAGGCVASGGCTQSPESINFVPTPPCSLTIKGVAYGAFLSVFSQTTVGLLQPTNSIIDGFLWADINAQAGKAFETFEYAGSSGYATGFDLKVYNPALGGSFTNWTDVPNQLEGFNLVTCNVPPPPFGGCTVTQGGWGAPAHGNNPGAFLNAKFGTAFPSGVMIGGSPFSLHFTDAQAIRNFLPQGGPPSFLNASATNPSSRTSAGVFAGQVLALDLNVALYNNFGSLTLSGTGTSLDGSTVSAILAAANHALAGGALPTGFSYSSLNDLIDNLNQSFDGCVADSWARTHLH